MRHLRDDTVLIVDGEVRVSWSPNRRARGRRSEPKGEPWDHGSPFSALVCSKKPAVIADVRVACSQCYGRAQTGSCDFVLRALAAISSPVVSAH